MSNPKPRPAELDPQGPEGVPLDAPGNDAPAISPQAVSRMHRSEDDGVAIEHSRDFSDTPAQPNQPRRSEERRQQDAPAKRPPDDVSRGLDASETRPQSPNPSHGNTKDAGEPPKGGGDGEIQEQPGTQREARDPGADNPKFDE